MQSPALGQRWLPDFVADGTAPVDLRVPVLLGDAPNEILQSIATLFFRSRDLDNESTILDGHIGWLALVRAKFTGERGRNSHGEAVASLQKLRSHGCNLHNGSTM